MKKIVIGLMAISAVVLIAFAFLYNNGGTEIAPLKETVAAVELPKKYQNDFSNVTNPASSIPVFMYHYFYDETSETPENGNFYSIQKFEQQLAHFKEEGYKTLTMEELYDWLEGKIEVPENSVVITMDDGYHYTYDMALPLLEKYGFVGVSFEITSAPEDYTSRLSHLNLELESHTHNMHQGTCPGMKPIQYGAIQCQDFDLAVADMQASADTIDRPIAMAYPFGGYDGQAKDVLRAAGYKLAFTTQYGIVERGMDYLELPRVRMSTDSFYY